VAPCVLVVEDDSDVREFMRTLLQLSGYETMVAENGAVALRMMQARRPCLVLLDLMMPVMDGFSFREQQVKEPALKDVPVVCVSAVYDAKEVARRLHLPCIAKPVHVESILEAVAERCKE
jgi:CheY-like chemotaxis protein